EPAPVAPGDAGGVFAVRRRGDVVEAGVQASLARPGRCGHSRSGPARGACRGVVRRVTRAGIRCNPPYDSYDSAPAPMTDAASPPNPAPLKLSVVIPVYNEQATVQQIVHRVVEAPLPEGMTREVVCVDDHSTDGTAARLDELPGLYPDVAFQIVHKPQN